MAEFTVKDDMELCVERSESLHENADDCRQFRHNDAMTKRNSNEQKTYIGIHKDSSGISPTGNIIRDAWVFGILPETETCEGWVLDRIETIYEKVSAAWEPYGSLASRLPPDLRERHARIYAEAVQRARAQGWNPELGDDD